MITNRPLTPILRSCTLASEGGGVAQEVEQAAHIRSVRGSNPFATTMLTYIDQPARTDARRAVVLLHGFGADANDLAGLGDLLNPDRRWRCCFPHAPIELDVVGMPGGRAWFPDDLDTLRRIQTGHYFEHIAEIDPPGLGAAADAVATLIAALGIDFGQCVLGGFSQGAIVSVEVCLRLRRVPAGLLLLSASCTAEQRWARELAGMPTCPLLQTHGRDDEVLPFVHGWRLFEMLREIGFAGQFESFRGGHSIPADLLPLLRARLTEWLSLPVRPVDPTAD